MAVELGVEVVILGFKTLVVFLEGAGCSGRKLVAVLWNEMAHLLEITLRFLEAVQLLRPKLPMIRRAHDYQEIVNIRMFPKNRGLSQ